MIGFMLCVGDFVFVEVVCKCQYLWIEFMDGCKVMFFLGDEILVVYGNCYVSDQFEFFVLEDFEFCYFVVLGGVVSCVCYCYNGVWLVIEIWLIGLVIDVFGDVVNFVLYSFVFELFVCCLFCFVVVGSLMNVGKMWMVMQFIWVFKKVGFCVGVVKVIGMGFGGDYWKFVDFGVDCVFDFGDVGYVLIYLVGFVELFCVFCGFVGELECFGVDVVVLEIVDGVFQGEIVVLFEFFEM